ncbi:hypothetical protein K493DRAFT_348775 [Basidiobolus meristosporus CBS 931.73]|uniref:Uncharacterized protein n=1 Tax=Basidiobolus meristosporus CBS 931.73 TaxID=1314790 RepID=A0A1Y1YM71_9FUNG|nr:hypothetical protein K493DRAFT_348775 [Basidiobolus meristosporus CBS 931.73]|eukprot:ORX99091.1 hypothetical protein K493DRAFT_348775 [Basidiobolus meristosporus CBS 931.73]
MSLAASPDAYYCNAQNSCSLQGYTCKDSKYCVSEVEASASCDKPFVARIGSAYTKFCSAAINIDAQVADASGCASYETYHHGICILKEGNVNLVAKSIESYYCDSSKACPIAGDTCKDNKYCVSEVQANSDCSQSFVARVSDVYTKFCKIPETLSAQAVDSSACASWETFHHGVCLLKEVTPQTATSMSQYFCSSSTSCPIAGHTCHYGKFCLPEASASSECTSDKATPFVARLNDTYTYFCDIPTTLSQYASSSKDCAKWENYHSGVCMLPRCSTSQNACLGGDKEMCAMLGVQSNEINCFGNTLRGNAHELKSAGLNGGQIAGITIGSLVGVALLGVAGLFAYRHRQKSRKTNIPPVNPTMESLPNYSPGNVKIVVDEKSRI